MKFCNKCDNMFYLGINKSNPNDITHYCRYCGNVDESASQNSSCIINTSTDYINDNNNIVVNEFTKLDPTLPHLENTVCPNDKCESHKPNNKNDVIYIRYDNNNMKYVYLCTYCDHTWKNE